MEIKLKVERETITYELEIISRDLKSVLEVVLLN